jgi:hypothetical protein
MVAFDADALGDLDARDAVHEFPFLAPGHPARYHSSEEVRAAYRWSGRTGASRSTTCATSPFTTPRTPSGTGRLLGLA